MDPHSASPAARPPAILVAEGDPAVRDSAVAFLRQIGVQAEAVADGQSAVRRVVATEPDVVLLGVRLPLMSGVEVLRSIRGVMPAGRQPRVVAVAAGETGETAEQLLAAGFDAVCPAPLSTEALRVVLEPPASADSVPAGRDAALVAQVRAHVTDLIGEDDPEFVADLTATFAETTQTALAEAGAALAAGEAEGVAAAAHQLRGSASNVGLTDLVAAWAAVEDAVRQQGAGGLSTAPVARALAETEQAVAILAGPTPQAA